MHGDQLGSVTALTTISGGLVSGSISRFYPFGGYRTTPTTNPGTTDQGYTGHKHNDSIDLIYMNARYYVPSIGRFASSDSIVPDAANPQSMNRFSYVLNNPLVFTDPTGHCEFGVNENGEDIITKFDCSLEDFDNLSIEDRKKWITIFMRQIPGAMNWFNNILGIIQGFIDYGLAEPGSWLSIGDAAILQGIQDGYALAMGIISESTNPGGPLWREFFEELWANPGNDDELIRLWGEAEQASTNYGVAVATSRNILPNPWEYFFLITGNAYRSGAASEGGLGTPFSYVTSTIGFFSGLDADLSVTAGYNLGYFFNDPRSLWRGWSPVYWYSILIWEQMEIWLS